MEQSLEREGTGCEDGPRKTIERTAIASSGFVSGACGVTLYEDGGAIRRLGFKPAPVVAARGEPRIPHRMPCLKEFSVSHRHARLGYFDIVAVCFVAFLLLSNIAATKLIGVDVALGGFSWHLVFDGGAILFPLTYILGDVLSEVYGFRRARRVIVTGFVVQILASLTFWLVQIAPSDPDYKNQEAFEAVLGQVPRFVAASLLGYLAGQLLNSLVLVKIKKAFGEKRLWARLLGSTVVGEAADTAVFCLIAWTGNAGWATIFNLMLVGFAYKVSVEAVFLPLTYAVIGFVKKTDPAYAKSSPEKKASCEEQVSCEEGVSKADGKEIAR